MEGQNNEMKNDDDGKHDSGELDFKKTAAEVGAASFAALKDAEKKVIKHGSLLKVAEEAEKFVRDMGFGIAFPINISISGIAAHYTPSLLDESIFPEKGLVKLDFGASKSGVLGDCALTIDLSGEYGKLAEASKQALDDAIATVKAGVKVRTIGKAIADAIESRGFKPIKNLGGHGVGIHELHAEPFIPNYDNGDEYELEEGTTVAIEPFATLPNGRGMVTDGDTREIFSFVGDYTQPRLSNSRALLKLIKNDYESEPFAARWLKPAITNKFELYSGLSELEKLGIIESHPVLVELSNSEVAQYEATVLVTKEGCEVLTK